MELNHIIYLQETIKIECESIMLTNNPANQALLNSLFVQFMTINTKALALLANPKEGDSVEDILHGLECMTVRKDSSASRTAFDALKENTVKNAETEETVEEILESLQSSCITRVPEY